MEKISIVIPAYNEEKRIGKTLELYSAFFNMLKKEKNLDYELLIVINNTTDNTENIVKNAQNKNDKIIYLNLKRGGKGYAVIEGFKEALKRSSDLIGFVDADLATSPEEYSKLIFSIGKFDGAIADRYTKGSKVFPPATFRRLVVGRIFNFLIRSLLFLPFKDTQCGAKLFKRSALERIIPLLGMSQWAFDVDLLYNLYKNKFNIISVPTIWIDKEYSKINFIRAGPWMALGIIRLRILNSPMKNLIRIYDKLVRFIPR